jgi:hypothetical protein
VSQVTKVEIYGGIYQNPAISVNQKKRDKLSPLRVEADYLSLCEAEN